MQIRNAGHKQRLFFATFILLISQELIKKCWELIARIPRWRYKVVINCDVSSTDIIWDKLRIINPACSYSWLKICVSQAKATIICKMEMTNYVLICYWPQGKYRSNKKQFSKMDAYEPLQSKRVISVSTYMFFISGFTNSALTISPQIVSLFCLSSKKL